MILSLSIRFLGTSDGAASAERGHAAILVRADDRCYLLDTGQPVSSVLVKTGESFEAIDRVLLTHLHADHVGGLPMLLQGMWLAGRKKPLLIHLPAEGVEYVETMRRTMYLFDEILPYRIELHPWQGGGVVQDGGHRIAPFPTSHLTHLRKQWGQKHGRACEAFAVRLETASGRSLVYSGDIGAPADLAAALAPEADVLICECAHFPASVLFDFLEGQKAGKIVLTHVAPPTAHAAVKAEGRRRFGDRFVFAEDGLECGI